MFYNWHQMIMLYQMKYSRDMGSRVTLKNNLQETPTEIFTLVLLLKVKHILFDIIWFLYITNKQINHYPTH